MDVTVNYTIDHQDCVMTRLTIQPQLIYCSLSPATSSSFITVWCYVGIGRAILCEGLTFASNKGTFVIVATMYKFPYIDIKNKVTFIAKDIAICIINTGTQGTMDRIDLFDVTEKIEETFLF